MLRVMDVLAHSLTGFLRKDNVFGFLQEGHLSVSG
jgi:hypothetical protein